MIIFHLSFWFWKQNKVLIKKKSYLVLIKSTNVLEKYKSIYGALNKTLMGFSTKTSNLPEYEVPLIITKIILNTEIKYYLLRKGYYIQN